MNLPRERFLIIIAAGLVIVLAACFLPASFSPVPGIAAVLAACLIPSAVMLILYEKLMEITGSPWHWWGKKRETIRLPDPAPRPISTLAAEANRNLALWCLIMECGGIVVIMSLFIPWFINTGVILVMFGVLVALLLAIDNRFWEKADRIDPAFSKTCSPGTALIPDIFMGTYRVAFICMMFVAMIIALVLSPLIASGFPSSPIPAVLGFPFYYLCLALLSAPGFVWLTIRRGD